MNLQRLLHLTVLLYIEIGVLKSSILTCLNASCCKTLRWTLTREVLLSLRGVSPKLNRSTQLYIATLGCADRRHGRCSDRMKCTAAENPEIPVIIRNRLQSKHCIMWRQSILTAVKISAHVGGIHAAAELNDHQPTAPTSFGPSAAAVETNFLDGNGPSADVPHSPSIY